jgi:ParB family transcriptional regulator, chromosome partitioning protein
MSHLNLLEVHYKYKKVFFMPPTNTVHVRHEIQRLPISKIRPAPERHYFGHDNLHKLAERMQVFGLIEPIVVKRVGDVFEIVSGKRRWLAAPFLGWRSIDAEIQDV